MIWHLTTKERGLSSEMVPTTTPLTGCHVSWEAKSPKGKESGTVYPDPVGSRELSGLGTQKGDNQRLRKGDSRPALLLACLESPLLGSP